MMTTVTTTSRKRLEQQSQSPYFECVTVPEGQSFLWRLDDYPRNPSVWNYHPEFEIHLIRHSSGLCFIGDYIGNFGAGQLVLVGSNLPHHWITPALGAGKIIGREIVIQFDPARIGAAAATFPEFECTGSVFERAACGVEFLGNTAKEGARVIEAMGSVPHLARLGLLAELLALMADSKESRTLATPKLVANFQPGLRSDIKPLEAAFAYVQTHYRERATLFDAAAVAGMSESAFSRFFKKQTGNTYTHHIVTLRVLAAKKLLAETTQAITAICYDSGFSNVSNFNRTFLSRIGMTPSQYRKAAHRRRAVGA
jgi:AraC-like DNA-binding protein